MGGFRSGLMVLGQRADLLVHRCHVACVIT